MTNVPLTPRQARKKLHRIVEQYGLDIGEIEVIPIELIREALRRFDIGLLPGRLEASEGWRRECQSIPVERQGIFDLPKPKPTV